MKATESKPELTKFERTLGGAGLVLGCVFCLLGIIFSTMYVGLMTTKENDIFQAYAGLTLWILGLFCLTTGVATFKQWAAASVMRGVFLFNLFVLAVGLVYFDIIKPITRPINIGSYFRAAIYILMLLGIIVGYRKAK